MPQEQPKHPRDLIQEHLAKGDYTAWFEALYSGAFGNSAAIPWADMIPSPDFVVWAEHNRLQGEGQRALVIGCGLGDDAEELARRGFDVTAFDISRSAIEWCKTRFPDTHVDYQAVDLLEPPAAWTGAFDFILESRTLQAMQWDMTERAIPLIAGLLRSRGRLLVLCLGREPEEDRRGIPWPLSRRELAGFKTAGLHEVSFEDLLDPQRQRRFRVVYEKA